MPMMKALGTSLWVFTAAILADSLGSACADAGRYAQFHSWVVGCDNIRTCKAIGFQGEHGNALILERAGEGTARPVLRLRMVWSDAMKGPLGPSLELLGDGASLGTFEVGPSFKVNSDEDHWNGDVTETAIEAGVLKALRTARKLVVRQPNGKAIVTLPLDGASAALLMMDDLQHRVGTQGALARPGDKPDSTVPAPPPLPPNPASPPVDKHPVSATVPAAVQRLFDEDRSKNVCDKDLRKSARERVRARLGPKLVLYSLPCWEGAYQGSDAYYLFHENGTSSAERLDLPRPVFGKVTDDEGPPQPAHVVGDEGFDPDDDTIGEYSKGRGIGDCGSVASWKWDGSRFVLTTYTTMPVCRGLTLDDWFDMVRSRDK